MFLYWNLQQHLVLFANYIMVSIGSYLQLCGASPFSVLSRNIQKDAISGIYGHQLPVNWRHFQCQMDFLRPTSNCSHLWWPFQIYRNQMVTATSQKWQYIDRWAKQTLAYRVITSWHCANFAIFQVRLCEDLLLTDASIAAWDSDGYCQYIKCGKAAAFRGNAFHQKGLQNNIWQQWRQ